jgi:Dolichyl-phosphate-mannose--protein O-mannosyl transferase
VSTLLARLNRPVVAILTVAIIAGGIRLIHLSHPPGFVFDEIYYPKAGCILLGWSDKTCHVLSSDELYWRANKWDVGSWVHPPLGKWTIALGIKAFGMNEFGWRAMSALAGTLVAVIVAGMAQVMFGRPLWTFIAGLLMAVEHLNVVMSRVGLLDIHLEFWVVLGFLCLLLDRRSIDRETPPEPQPMEVADAEGVATTVLPRWKQVPSPLWRPWRFAAGLAFGAACAVKWDGITALGAAVFLSYLWETTRRHREGVSRGRAFARALAMETFGLTLAFLVVPVAIYMAAWLPWFHHFGWNLSAWWKDHVDMWHYHASLREFALDTTTHKYTPTHPYYSRPWTWLPMIRPVSFFSQHSPGHQAEIVAIGSPAIFWGSLWALPYMVFAWRRKLDWRAGFILVAFLMQWLPWFAVRRPQFFFYVLPCTPFMVLAVAYLLRDLSRARLVLHDKATGEIAINPDTGQPAISTQRPYRWIAWAFVAGTVALFIWFWPVLTGGTLTDAMWRARLWFRGWI